MTMQTFLIALLAIHVVGLAGIFGLTYWLLKRVIKEAIVEAQKELTERK